MDGAPACPFVAFGDDREARSTSPDHRHRCFAESPAAPRALAHQEAYCLSSAFPVCPTFQDWARREAAHALAAGDQAAAPPPPAAATPPPPPVYDLYADWSMPTPEPLPPGMEPLSDVGPSDLEPPSEQASDESEEPIQRNPPRDWAAPPPWATGAATAAALSGRPAGPGTPGQGGSPSEPPPPSRQVEGQGLAGSPADRLAAGEVPAAVAWSASAGGHAATAPDEELAGLVQPRSSSTSGSAPAGSSATGDQSVPAAALAAAAAAAAASAPAQSAPQPVVRSSDPYPPSTRTGKRPSVSSTRDVVTGPTWERIQRVDTYPTIKSGSSMRGVPRIALFVGALAIAALILFMLPAIIGIGGGGSSSSASPSGSHPAASRSAAPTVVAAPTPVVYVIKKGDTLSKVANKFGVELDTLLAANPAIKDPNKISLGQEIVIPTAAPPSIEATAKPSASTAPE
jgi:hypothetical protein